MIRLIRQFFNLAFYVRCEFLGLNDIFLKGKGKFEDVKFSGSSIVHIGLSNMISDYQECRTIFK